jgi:hypothetical protein
MRRHLGEWDWWYYDSSGYVSVNPRYPYDVVVMGFEGGLVGVKSLPCILHERSHPELLRRGARRRLSQRR